MKLVKPLVISVFVRLIAMTLYISESSSTSLSFLPNLKSSVLGMSGNVKRVAATAVNWAKLGEFLERSIIFSLSTATIDGNFSSANVIHGSASFQEKS